MLKIAELLGGRKVVAVVVGLVAGFLAQSLYDGAEAKQLQDYTLYLLGSFMGSNAIAKIGEGIAKRS